MGKIYDPPKKVGVHPNIGPFIGEGGRFDLEGLEKAEKEWEEKLRAWCKEHSDDELAGELIKEPVADGQAVYMIFSTKPVKLIHIPFGDAYEFRWAHRWTASDIRTMVEDERQRQAVLTKVRK